ncbi:HAD hydrolase-like protein [Roseomonas sp. E05]|uniref:HAD hydrolase-like protein n=1 Tax=Roseomonas sp. E05 TaxID=3046310 RepID=UPI0024BABE5D|nr:HAD hydrolase-like protein [Roseomonas sp. E05]MDJ0386797.1 HAD hydrolase-like protein [Roseomonas sp. E05]
MRYRLVIFDFDGTLADSFPWFTGALNEAARRFGFRVIDAEEGEALRALGAREIMRRLDVPGWKLPWIIRHLRREKQAVAGTLPLFPGVPELLAALPAAGARLAIVSSDSEVSIRATLGPGLAGLIGHYGTRASLFGKPRKLRAVLRQTGTPAREAIYMGDERRDAEAAQAVGMDFGAVAWGYATRAALAGTRPALIFDSPAEIMARFTEAAACPEP